jgi:hypothetical protein
MEYKNFGNTGTHTASHEGMGQVVLNASCAGGTLAIRGNVSVTDNAGGAVTLSEEARVTQDTIADATWDEAKAGHVTAGSFGEEMQAHALSTEIDALPTGVENADALLGRNIASGSDGGRDVTSALRRIRNKVSLAAGTLTVTEEDDSTSAWTAAVLTTASDPISSVDPT